MYLDYFVSDLPGRSAFQHQETGQLPDQALEVELDRTGPCEKGCEFPALGAQGVELLLSDGSFGGGRANYVLVLPLRRHEDHRRLKPERRWGLAKRFGDFRPLERMWHMNP